MSYDINMKGDDNVNEQEKLALFKRTFVWCIKHKRINSGELRFQATFRELCSYYKYIKVDGDYVDLASECIDFFKQQKLFSERSYTQKLTYTRRSSAWGYRYLTQRGYDQAVKLGLEKHLKCSGYAVRNGIERYCCDLTRAEIFKFKKKEDDRLW